MLLFKYFPYYYIGEKLCKIDGFCGDCTSYSICTDNPMLSCKVVESDRETNLEIYTFKK